VTTSLPTVSIVIASYTTVTWNLWNHKFGYFWRGAARRDVENSTKRNLSLALHTFQLNTADVCKLALSISSTEQKDLSLPLFLLISR
jgi:hypothetical protein